MFLFSAWLNVVHGYEHDDHDEHEQHPEECEICILLASLTDYLVDDCKSIADHLFADTHYLFIAKNNLSAAIHFANPRAPPHIRKI